MVEIVTDYDLKNLNTFGISAKAKFFAVLENEADIAELFESMEFKNNEKLFLGGGSNMLFTKDFDGIVILNKLKGIEILNEDNNTVSVKFMGGEVWNDAVDFAVDRNYWGIENLALVPGSVGATPVQNIGAYGSEIKDTLENVEAYEIESGNKKVFLNKECEFGYRNSIFKNELKGKYFISAVILKLNKNFFPNISYKVLKDYIEENKIEIKNSKDVANAVANIRRSKLPDPKELGNAGSFFKNTFINQEQLEKLLVLYPEMPNFSEQNEKGENVIKIPSAWLIEQCGFKGLKEGNVGSHTKQALVIVNYGGATGGEVKDFVYKIIKTVKDKFDINLEPEVNVI